MAPCSTGLNKKGLPVATVRTALGISTTSVDVFCRRCKLRIRRRGRAWRRAHRPPRVLRVSEVITSPYGWESSDRRERGRLCPLRPHFPIFFILVITSFSFLFVCKNIYFNTTLFESPLRVWSTLSTYMLQRANWEFQLNLADKGLGTRNWLLVLLADAFQIDQWEWVYHLPVVINYTGRERKHFNL